MEEKIKISISEEIYELLKKDSFDFDVTHKNKKINLNLFLNILIANYYEDFSKIDLSINKNISKIINNDDPELIKRIIQTVNNSDSLLKKKEKTKSFSFRPTKLIEKAVVHITNYLINGESISSFYRRLLTSYSKKIKNEREKIIFKETYNNILNSIKERKETFIEFKSGAIYKNASIYDIKTPKDEFYNYVLFETNNGIRVTVRLCKIKQVIVLLSPASFLDKNIILFKKSIKYGVQYLLEDNENEPVKIALSSKGIKLYNRIYLYRPDYEEVTNNVYIFYGPYEQIIQYFRRFGKEAFIVSPLSLRKKMEYFYSDAYKRYKRY